MIRRVLALALLWPMIAGAFDNFTAVPGGIAGIVVGDATTEPPRVLFGSHEVPVLRFDQGWTALVGLARDLAPGNYVVNAVDGESGYASHTFAVKPVSRPIYPVDAPEASTLADVVARHRRALRDLPGEDLGQHDDPPDLDFVLPADLPIRFQYGLLHFSGSGYTLDFPGLGFEPGEPADVVSPAFGQVVAIDERDGRWRLVIHHGAGLVSVFRNLGGVSVTLEDWVPKGARIATLAGGAGIKLLPDWTVRLGDADIDPLLLVSQRISLEAAPAAETPAPLVPRANTD